MQQRIPELQIIENETGKALLSPGNYMSVFNKKSGFFARWKDFKPTEIENSLAVDFSYFIRNGLFDRLQDLISLISFMGKTEEFFDGDPSFCPWSPEILDIEVSTICNGVNGKPCHFCYKSNTGVGKNMTLDQFKTILQKVSKRRTLCQTALGIGDIDSNPDLWKMMEFCREINIVPNITINGWNLTDKYAENLSRLCGACAVSKYDSDICYDAVKKLTDLGMEQINIHIVVSNENMEECLQTIKDAKNDPRLRKLNAIIFLMLKPKGRGKKVDRLTSLDKYSELINFALENEVNIGFDSCSAISFLRAVKDNSEYKSFQEMAEPCESSLFSAYINVLGEYAPCSFCEGEEGWTEGISVLECEDFLQDIWYNPRVVQFRENLIETIYEKKSSCPMFNLDLEEKVLDPIFTGEIT